MGTNHPNCNHLTVWDGTMAITASRVHQSLFQGCHNFEPRKSRTNRSPSASAPFYVKRMNCRVHKDFGRRTLLDQVKRLMSQIPPDASRKGSSPSSGMEGLVRWMSRTETSTKVWAMNWEPTVLRAGKSYQQTLNFRTLRACLNKGMGGRSSDAFKDKVR